MGLERQLRLTRADLIPERGTAVAASENRAYASHDYLAH
jgi:hypothetical protein